MDFLDLCKQIRSPGAVSHPTSKNPSRPPSHKRIFIKRNASHQQFLKLPLFGPSLEKIESFLEPPPNDVSPMARKAKTQHPISPFKEVKDAPLRKGPAFDSKGKALKRSVLGNSATF